MRQDHLDYYDHWLQYVDKIKRFYSKIRHQVDTGWDKIDWVNFMRQEDIESWDEYKSFVQDKRYEKGLLQKAERIIEKDNIDDFDLYDKGYY